MTMLDLKVWKKTVKVIVQAVALCILISIFILVLASIGQQSVYRNLDVDRNAFVDTWEHIWNYEGVKE